MIAERSRLAVPTLPSEAGLLGQIAGALGTTVDALCETAPLRMLHKSENGDEWVLLRGAHGKLVVRHVGNDASGGNVTDTVLAEFLVHDVGSPQHQALAELVDQALAVLLNT